MTERRAATIAGASSSAWSKLKARVATASPETKSTTAGAFAGGAVAGTAGAHVEIAAFGTAVAGTALLPIVCVGVGGVAGHAGYKFYRDIKTRRSEHASSRSPSEE
jgi:hypothetical protein